MIVYNNQQQLTGHCSFQEYSVLLQSPPRNNGNQGQHAIIVIKLLFIVVIDRNVNNAIDNQTVSMNQTIQQCEENVQNIYFQLY